MSEIKCGYCGKAIIGEPEVTLGGQGKELSFCSVIHWNRHLKNARKLMVAIADKAKKGGVA